MDVEESIIKFHDFYNHDSFGITPYQYQPENQKEFQELINFLKPLVGFYDSQNQSPFVNINYRETKLHQSFHNFIEIHERGVYVAGYLGKKAHFGYLVHEKFLFINTLSSSLFILKQYEKQLRSSFILNQITEKRSCE